MTPTDLPSLVEWIKAYLHVTGSLLAMSLAIGVVLAYGRIIPRETGMVRYFAVSQVLIFGVYATRAVFWSGRALYRMFDPNDDYVPTAWYFFINAPLNILFIIASYCALKAVHRMIPEDDRSNWRWYSAPLYPPWRWLVGADRLAARLRRCLWRSNGSTDRRATKQPITFPDRRDR